MINFKNVKIQKGFQDAVKEYSVDEMKTAFVEYLENATKKIPKDLMDFTSEQRAYPLTRSILEAKRYGDVTEDDKLIIYYHLPTDQKELDEYKGTYGHQVSDGNMQGSALTKDEASLFRKGFDHLNKVFSDYFVFKERNNIDEVKYNDSVIFSVKLEGHNGIEQGAEILTFREFSYLNNESDIVWDKEELTAIINNEGYIKYFFRSLAHEVGHAQYSSLHPFVLENLKKKSVDLINDVGSEQKLTMMSYPVEAIDKIPDTNGIRIPTSMEPALFDRMIIEYQSLMGWNDVKIEPEKFMDAFLVKEMSHDKVLFSEPMINLLAGDRDLARKAIKSYRYVVQNSDNLIGLINDEQNLAAAYNDMKTYYDVARENSKNLTIPEFYDLVDILNKDKEISDPEFDLLDKIAKGLDGVRIVKKDNATGPDYLATEYSEGGITQLRPVKTTFVKE